MVIVTEKTIRRVPPLGVSKLSELTIDVDKDWGGYKIKNLGAPVDAGDAVRKTDLDSHRTSSPIDHPDGSVAGTKISNRITFVTSVSMSAGSTYTPAPHNLRFYAYYNTGTRAGLITEYYYAGRYNNVIMYGGGLLVSDGSLRFYNPSDYYTTTLYIFNLT